MSKVLSQSVAPILLLSAGLVFAQATDVAGMPAAEDAASSSDALAGGSGDELQEIVLPSRDPVEEEPYLDELDAPVVDNDSETDEERLSRLFTLYLNAVSDRQFEEADTLAKQVVELTIRTYGLDSDESAKALTNLAIAQHGISDFESSILNYEAAIGIIERIDDRLSYDLINPLRGLGAAQLASGRPDLARDSFNRAVHISHVNEGPHNLEQVETLESLAETYLSVGEYEDAVDIQKRIYYLQARGVNASSLDIIPALKTRAGWQHRMQLYDQERFTWRRMISVIEDNKGKDSLDLIEPLTQLGNSYLFIGFSDSPYAQTASVTSGEVYLKRAVRVAEANPDAGWPVLTETMLELGDYYLRSARPHRAQRVYEEAWKILSTGDDPEKLKVRAEQLETVTVLQDIAPPKMYGGDPAVPVRDAPPGYETGTATYEYAVSVRGTPMNIRLVDSDPQGLDDMYQAVARDIRRLIYRPRLEDGEMSMSEVVNYTHTFYYREADLPEDATTARADGVDPTDSP